MLIDGQNLVRNPDVLLRDDLPDNPLLYDPATDAAFGLNPTARLIWTHLDECPTVDGMRDLLCERLQQVPAEAEQEIAAFVAQLRANGLAAASG